MKKYGLKRWLWLLPGIFAFILTQYAMGHADGTEQIYSLKIYPVLTNLVGWLPSLVGFSVAEWLVLLFIAFWLGFLIFYGRKLFLSKKGRRQILVHALANGLAVLSVVYFLFTMLGGLNYYRHTFTEYTGYTVGTATESELELLCENLVTELNAVRAELPENIYDDQGFSEYSELAVTAMQDLAEDYPVLARSLYSAPKPVLFSEVMSQGGIAGVFFPFTVESNINTQVPFYMIPSTMAHELAHQTGFMREDEANFIAYLACLKVDNSLMNYSGLSLAFNHAISALNRVNEETATAIRGSLSQQVQADRTYYSAYLSNYRGDFYDFFTKVNDAYLKTNNQSDGVASYGRMVELLLAEQVARN